jgi:hypothetical protein
MNSDKIREAVEYYTKTIHDCSMSPANIHRAALLDLAELVLKLDGKVPDIKFVSMNIVKQLFDEAEVPVKKRHEINDKCDEFVEKLISETIAGIAGLLQRRKYVKLIDLRDWIKTWHEGEMSMSRLQELINDGIENKIESMLAEKDKRIAELKEENEILFRHNETRANQIVSLQQPLTETRGKVVSVEEIAGLMHKNIYGRPMREDEPVRNLHIYAVAKIIHKAVYGEENK